MCGTTKARIGSSWSTIHAAAANTRLISGANIAAGSNVTTSSDIASCANVTINANVPSCLSKNATYAEKSNYCGC